MSTTPTTHYSFGKPAVGGDSGSWGTELNAALDLIDSTIFGVSGTASAALPASGGAMTGRIDGKTSTVQMRTISVSGAWTIDLSVAQYLVATITGAITGITLTNVPAVSNSACGLILRLQNAGAVAISWPASFKWPGGVIPTFTVAGTDIVTFLTDNNGTTWQMMGIQLNVH